MGHKGEVTILVDWAVSIRALAVGTHDGPLIVAVPVAVRGGRILRHTRGSVDGVVHLGLCRPANTGLERHAGPDKVSSNARHGGFDSYGMGGAGQCRSDVPGLSPVLATLRGGMSCYRQESGWGSPHEHSMTGKCMVLPR